ncbi:hypothetical protein Tco_0835008 [Tanacetum coccineum]
MVQETTNKVVQIKEGSKRQEITKRAMLTIDKAKLASRYVGPFAIIEWIGLIAYHLRLPQELSSVHDTFHVSNLKKCLADTNLHVPLDEIKVEKTLCFVKEPMEIMDREVKKLKRSKILIVKVHWNSKIRGNAYPCYEDFRIEGNAYPYYVDVGSGVTPTRIMWMLDRGVIDSNAKIGSVAGLIDSEEAAEMVLETKAAKAQDKYEVVIIARKKVTSIVSVRSPRRTKLLSEELEVIVKTVMNLKMTQLVSWRPPQEVQPKQSISNNDLDIIDLQKENKELLRFNKHFSKTNEKLLLEKHALKKEHSKLFSKVNELELELRKLTKSKE